MHNVKSIKHKKEHTTFSNILYFIKLLFSVSPLLVIGECIWGVLLVCRQGLSAFSV